MEDLNYLNNSVISNAVNSENLGATVMAQGRNCTGGAWGVEAEVKACWSVQMDRVQALRGAEDNFKAIPYHYDTKFWWGWFESLRCMV